MTDIEKARERIQGLIERRYPRSNFANDMTQIALIEYANGSTIYQGIAKARSEERKWTKPKRLYGEITSFNIDNAGAIEQSRRDDRQKERSEVAIDILLRLLHLPISKLSSITGKSKRQSLRDKNSIRELLGLDSEVGYYI